MFWGKILRGVLLRRSCKILVIIKVNRYFLSGVTAKPLVLSCFA